MCIPTITDLYFAKHTSQEHSSKQNAALYPDVCLLKIACVAGVRKGGGEGETKSGLKTKGLPFSLAFSPPTPTPATQASLKIRWARKTGRKHHGPSRLALVFPSRSLACVAGGTVVRVACAILVPSRLKSRLVARLRKQTEKKNFPVHSPPNKVTQAGNSRK